MTIRQYYWNDPGAPTLSYASNSFNNILRACLINGYSGKDPAGWTEEFSTGNRLVIRSPGGNRRYFEFNDGASNYVYIRGYLDFDTSTGSGTGPFPTTAQSSNGYNIVKSSSTSSTIFRPWSLICSDRSVYFSSLYSLTDEFGVDNTLEVCIGFFGDFVSFVPSDTGNSMIYCNLTASTSSTNQTFGDLLSNTTVTSGPGLCVAKDFTGTQTAYNQMSISPSWVTGGSLTLGSNGVPFPDPVSGGILLDPVRILEYPDSTYKIVRGQMPGLFNPLHNNPSVHRATFTGVGSLDGSEVVLWRKGRTSGKIAFSTNMNDWV